MNTSGASAVIEWDGLNFDASELNEVVRSRLRRKRYESGTIDKLLATCPTDIPFINFGGGIGVVDCFQNRRMDHPNQHVSVEGNPNGCRINATNRKINDAKYTIINKALAYTAKVRFFIPDHTTQLIMDGAADSRFADKGTKGEFIEVPGTTLSDLIEEFGFEKCAICIDAEGAEFGFIENEIKLISKRCSWLLIEWHYEDDDVEMMERTDKCKRLLKSHFGFDAQNSSSRFSIFYGRPTFKYRLFDLRRKIRAWLS